MNYSITFDQAKLLSRTCVITQPRSNSIIFQEGMQGGSLMFIISGTVQMSTGNYKLKELKSGEWFGGQVFIGLPVNYQITSVTNCTLLCWNLQSFDVITQIDNQLSDNIINTLKLYVYIIIIIYSLWNLYMIHLDFQKFPLICPIIQYLYYYQL